MKKNKVAEKLFEARKEKVEVKLNIRKQSNGQFSSVSGKVSELKVAKSGEAYVVVKGGKHGFQTVALENVLMVVKDGTVYKR